MQGADFGEVFLLEAGEFGLAQLRDQASETRVPDDAPPGFGMVEQGADVVAVGAHVGEAGAGVKGVVVLFEAELAPGEFGRVDAVALDALQKKIDEGFERSLVERAGDDLAAGFDLADDVLQQAGHVGQKEQAERAVGGVESGIVKADGLPLHRYR